ncbi:unnamed protein product [Acanthocheilonema viteae]|uniref:Uncharacterized protein n=1 Tax=Acanthocheilonema viteae TaxID=6277 RepID=A0A498SPH0_ACAVI|nr:unnamed protein product [Acanthocheilonema viteae]
MVNLSFYDEVCSLLSTSRFIFLIYIGQRLYKSPVVNSVIDFVGKEHLFLICISATGYIVFTNIHGCILISVATKGNMYPVSSGVIHPMSSRIMHPVPTRIMHPMSSGVMYPMQSRIPPPVSSISEHFHHQPGTYKDPLYTHSGNLEQKNHNSKQLLKSDPSTSMPAMDTSVAKNSKHLTSPLSTEVCVPTSMIATPCFSSSAPEATNTFQPQSPSKDMSSYKSASQKGLFSLDTTPKRKTERRLARHIRRQQQADVVNFAGAKFSESPQAKVVPLPPFIWCEEASSSSSCSGDEQSISLITEVIKMEMPRHGDETPKWNKCSSSLQVMPLHFVAALPSS